MMVEAATAEAVRRVAERANDVLAAFAPGAMPVYGDVRTTAAPLASSDPLSVAAPAGAWFIVSDAAGARTYTRAGNFHVDDGGTLRGAGGAAILGFTGSDGTLAYTRSAIDPRTRERSVERAVVARLALARFPAGTAPLRIDATQAAAPEGVLPHVGRPDDGLFAPLTVHARDAGGVDLDAGLARLSEAYLTLRALHAAQRAASASQKVATDLVK
jgi:hypothetical protein